MRTLTVAEQQIVEIVKALSVDARVIQMDEPTAALADHEVELLYAIVRRLQARGVAILYVSHRLKEIFDLCDTITVLKDGALVSSGPASELDTDELVRRMVGRPISAYFPEAEEGTELGEPRLELRGAGNGYVDGIDLELRAGEIVGVAGLQGSGRTELVEALFGIVPFTRGELLLDGRPVHMTGARQAVKAGIALITEDRKAQGLALNQSVADNALLVIRSVFARRTGEVRRELPGVLSSLEVASQGVDQEVQYLSGGNQQKVVLAKWLATKPRSRAARRAHPRHRRRREGRRLPAHAPTRQGGRRHPHDLLRAPRGHRHVRPHHRDARRTGLRRAARDERRGHDPLRRHRHAAGRRGRPRGIREHRRRGRGRHRGVESRAAGRRRRRNPARPRRPVGVGPASDARRGRGGGVMTTTTATPARRGRRRRLDASLIVGIALVAVIVIGAILVATVGRNFFSAGNIRDILTGMSVLGFVAIGQTLVILCASLDLSVPYVVSLSSLIAADMMAGNPANIPIAVLAVLVVAAAIGLANGLIVTKLKVNGFIATLGTGLIIKGYLDTNYQGTSGAVPPAFQYIGATGIGPVPISTLLMLARRARSAAFFLARTRTGNHMFAVGGNEQVARLSGIRTARPLIVAHMLCSITAALAGLLLASRLGVGSPTVGIQGGYDLLSIAAVVLGGTLLMGGRGSIWGTIGGVAIFAVVDNVMSVMQVNPFLKDVVRGVVIVAAVAVYTSRSLDRRRPRFTSAGPGTTTPDAAREQEVSA